MAPGKCLRPQSCDVGFHFPPWLAASVFCPVTKSHLDVRVIFHSFLSGDNSIPTEPSLPWCRHMTILSRTADADIGPDPRVSALVKAPRSPERDIPPSSWLRGPYLRAWS